MNIALFASGTGSNVYNIIQHFKSNDFINVVAVLSNKTDAGALNHAKNAGIQSLTFSKKEFTSAITVEEHPALVPHFGGKGMYGLNVHNAVISSTEQKSGVTIHFVNEKYDDGATIAQFECDLNEHDTPQSLAQKVRVLEKAHFPKTIEEYILKIK